MKRWGWTLLLTVGCAEELTSPPLTTPDAVAADLAVDAAAFDAAPPDALPDGPTPDAAPPVVEGVVGAQVAAGPHLGAAWIEGRPVVAWYDPGERALMFAIGRKDAPRDSADWTRYALHPDGRYPSVAVIDGRPAVLFFDATEGALRLAHADGPSPDAASWTTHTIDSDGAPGSFADLAVAGHDVAAAYRDGTTGALRVATATTWPPSNIAHWRVEVVDDEGDAGHFASLGIVDGQPVVAYHEATAGVLKLARRDDAGWTIETIDAEGTVGRFAALAPSGELVAYRDDTRGTLKVALRGAEGWDTEHVDETGDAGHANQIHTAFGGLVITHFDARAGRLKRAVREADGWRLDSVATPRRVDGGALFAAHPCGGVDDLGVGAHTGLHLYRADTGRLELAYDATDGDAWFRRPAAGAIRGATTAALLPGDLPTLAYGVGDRGLFHAVATTWPPTDSADWEVRRIAAGAPAGLVAGPGSLAWRDGDSVRMARAPDWTAGEVPLPPGGPVAGLIEVDGRAATAARDAQGAVHFARATPEGWSTHSVDPAPTVGSLAALVAIDGRPALFYTGAPDEDGRPTLQFSHATVPEPADSADWGGRHRVELSLPDAAPIRALDAAVVDGRPVALVTTDVTHFVRARNDSPTGPGDWQPHVADGSPVQDGARVVERDGTPALLYGALAPDSTLRLATTGTHSPGGRQAWTFSRVDLRGGPTPRFHPAGIQTYRLQRAVAYRVRGCVVLARSF